MNAYNKFSVLLFDLDGTLYDINNGYIENQKKNIYNFLIYKNISSEINVNEYWNSIFSKYNQNVRIDKQVIINDLKKNDKQKEFLLAEILFN